MIIQALMNQIKDELPVVKTCLEQYGECSLDEYLDTIHHETNPTSEIQSSEDIKEAVFDYLKRILGKDPAYKTAEQIGRQKLLLSANHHEAEFCVQSLQGNILYEQLLQKRGFTDSIVPVFSGTTVNMSNRNYPRGMLIYHSLTMINAVKIPIYPTKYRNSLVAACKPFTKDMILNAVETVAREKRKGTISKEVSQTAIELLETKFKTDSVLACSRYADQVVMLNKDLGHGLYQGLCPDKRIEFIYIEIEEISRRLIEKDLERKNNLGYSILFQRELRNRILENLNHKTGCWKSELLKVSIQGNTIVEKMESAGTHFFWGIDENACRFPLLLNDRKERPELLGRDMHGLIYRYEYTSESILHLLRTKKIIPGLMLTFFQFYMVRDFTMLGGCFQKDYLRQMQLGIIRTLQEIGWIGKDLEFLRNKKSHYLSGPMFLLGGQPHNRYPMSTVELINEGGLTGEKLRRHMDLSMQRAHEIGIYNFYWDLFGQNERLPDWWKTLSGEL